MTTRNYTFALLSIIICTAAAVAVTSKNVTIEDADKLLEGKTDSTIINSDGTIKLAPASITVTSEEMSQAWIIHSIVADDEAVYMGTSPNGEIFKYQNEKLTKIFSPKESTQNPDKENGTSFDDLFNEHIFAMAFDNKNRLLAAVSGLRPRLIRYENGKFETVFKSISSAYIHSLSVADNGDIYMATGPEGRIYKTPPSGDKLELVYQSQSKNLLATAFGPDGFLYAGSDEEGLIYKINTKTKTASILYDSDQEEITSLVFDSNGTLYAAATSAASAARQPASAQMFTRSAPGRTEQANPAPTPPPATNNDDSQGSKSLQAANTKENSNQDKSQQPPQIPQMMIPSSASFVYSIDTEGFVKEIFSEKAVFFSMAAKDHIILIGTGNDGRVYSVNTKTETKAIAHENQKSSQITAAVTNPQNAYLAASNPPALVILENDYANLGTYTSKPIDAQQPAMWGKMQLDATIPAKTKIMLACRSGNTADPNSPTFSPWSTDIQLTEDTDLTCPVGRFMQYRLTLKTDDPGRTPIIRKTVVSYVVPNLAPKVTEVKINRPDQENNPHIAQIKFSAEDANEDKLKYLIQFKKTSHIRWIKLAENHQQDSYTWNTRTVPDGRYEVRVTADDGPGNSPSNTLKGSRISDRFVVDNTPPNLTNFSAKAISDSAVISLTANDKFTAIGSASFIVDSGEHDTSILPEDMIYDTTTEHFTIKTESLEPGPHIITLKISDDLGNTAYKSFEIVTGQ